MSLRPKPVLLLFIVICVSFAAQAQDTTSAAGKIAGLHNRFLSSIDTKTASLENKLTKPSEKYLSRLFRQEEKLKRKLARKDSTAAKKIFDSSVQKYNALT